MGNLKKIILIKLIILIISSRKCSTRNRYFFQQTTKTRKDRVSIYNMLSCYTATKYHRAQIMKERTPNVCLFFMVQCLDIHLSIIHALLVLMLVDRLSFPDYLFPNKRSHFHHGSTLYYETRSRVFLST